MRLDRADWNRRNVLNYFRKDKNGRAISVQSKSLTANKFDSQLLGRDSRRSSNCMNRDNVYEKSLKWKLKERMQSLEKRRINKIRRDIRLKAKTREGAGLTVQNEIGKKGEYELESEGKRNEDAMRREEKSKTIKFEEKRRVKAGDKSTRIRQRQRDAGEAAPKKPKTVRGFQNLDNLGEKLTSENNLVEKINYDSVEVSNDQVSDRAHRGRGNVGQTGFGGYKSTTFDRKSEQIFAKRASNMNSENQSRIENSGTSKVRLEKSKMSQLPKTSEIHSVVSENRNMGRVEVRDNSKMEQSQTEAWESGCRAKVSIRRDSVHHPLEKWARRVEPGNRGKRCTNRSFQNEQSGAPSPRIFCSGY